VINGTVSGLDAAFRDDAMVGTVEPLRMIDLSMISPKVQKAVSELVRRTALAGAWKAAYDYANHKFVGLDLTFAIAELDKASAMTSSTDALHLIDSMSIPPMPDPASEALTQARETLGTHR
jgi:hypothetical protein